MGKAIFCDRCGKLFDKEEIDIRKGKILDFWNEEMIVYLCPKCKEGLEDYVYGKDLNKKKN